MFSKLPHLCDISIQKEKSEKGVGCSKLLHIPPESFWCTAFSEQL